MNDPIPVRVLIADDHHIVREGLRLILETMEEFEVVGEAEDGRAAVERGRELRPDVVLMDLRMPGLSGMEAIRELRIEVPEIQVVILTTYDEDHLMVEGIRARARGYLLKDTDRETLFNTIRAAARGETLLSPRVAKQVLTGAARSSVPSRLGSARGGRLTDREREILTLLTGDRRNREIAARLGISERTVKAHLASIYTKLSVDSRAGAVAKALREGLLEVGG